MQNMPCCQLCFYRPSQSGPRQESAAIHIAWPLTWHKSFSFSLSFPPFAWFLPSFLSFQESGWRASSHSSFPFSDPLLRCCQGSSPGGGVPGRQVCVVIYLIRPNVTRCCFLCVCVTLTTHLCAQLVWDSRFIVKSCCRKCECLSWHLLKLYIYKLYKNKTFFRGSVFFGPQNKLGAVAIRPFYRV